MDKIFTLILYAYFIYASLSGVCMSGFRDLHLHHFFIIIPCISTNFLLSMQVLPRQVLQIYSDGSVGGVFEPIRLPDGSVAPDQSTEWLITCKEQKNEQGVTTGHRFSCLICDTDGIASKTDGKNGPLVPSLDAARCHARSKQHIKALLVGLISYLIFQMYTTI